jgi:3-phosphoshikimate 1-carboxyvinyltransferase
MKTIKPFHFKHSIQANASKSDAQRCLILAALSNSTTIIHGLDGSDDVRAMLSCIEGLGATFHPKEGVIEPISERNKDSIDLNVGESGFALRSLSFVGMALTKKLNIQGSGTLLKRDQTQLCQLLEQAGLSIQSNSKKLPLQIEGQVTLDRMTVNGEEGSQAISGLFLLAPFLTKGIHISIEALKSRPYLEMTIQRMRDFGITLEEKDPNSYFIPGSQICNGQEIQIEGDWSGAANHLVGAAISGELTIDGLKKDSLQADRKILEVLQDFGAKFHWEGNRLKMSQSETKTPFETDIRDCPDLFPILVVLACAARGKSRIVGVDRLKNKESDRLSVMCEILETFDVPFKLESNAIVISGKETVSGGIINTHQDHRIAMASTIAACIASSSIVLTEENCVTKSYPSFFTDLFE